jgi:hypothetical protein
MKKIDWWQVSSGVSNCVSRRSYSGGFDITAQSVSFQSQRLRQKEIHWIRYVLLLKERWLTRRVSVISW